MHQQDAQLIAQHFEALYERVKLLDKVVLDMHSFLQTLAKERTDNRIPERMKALEDAYAEILLMGKEDK